MLPKLWKLVICLFIPVLYCGSARAQMVDQKYGAAVDCAANNPADWKLQFLNFSDDAYQRSTFVRLDHTEVGVLNILPKSAGSQGVAEVEYFELEIEGGSDLDSVFLLWSHRQHPLTGNLRPELDYETPEFYSVPLNQRFRVYRWIPCRTGRNSQAGVGFQFLISLCSPGEQSISFKLVDVSGAHTGNSEIVCRVDKNPALGSCMYEPFDTCGWIESLPFEYKWLNMFFLCS